MVILTQQRDLWGKSRQKRRHELNVMHRLPPGEPLVREAPKAPTMQAISLTLSYSSLLDYQTYCGRYHILGTQKIENQS